MKMSKLILAGIAVALAAVLPAAEVVVHAKGEGRTYRMAVNEALISAVRQHRGGTLTSAEQGQVTTAVTSVAQDTNGKLDSARKTEINDAVSRAMKLSAVGQFLGYTPVMDAYDAANASWIVELDVRFAGPYVVGLNPANRRRMAVVTFRPARASYTWHGQAGNSLDWASSLADKLNVRLTKTRKFTMLDRKFDAEQDAELARLTAANANPSEVVRMAQRLGTDYLIVGEIRVNDVQAPQINPFTGLAMPRTSALFAEVTYRVLLAPTGQLKWTDTVRLDAASFAAGDLASFISQTTDAAAMSIADGLMANILPFEIVSKTGDGQLVIGEGGDSLRVGEFLTVFTLGEEVRDSRTGEVLDTVETVAGTVQIVRVTPKLSYARAVEGDAAKMVAGARLRRVSPVAGGAPEVAPSQPATPVKTTPEGVILPF